MRWFQWFGWRSNRRIRSHQRRQPQRLSVFRPASYERPSRKPKRGFAHPWSGEHWKRDQRLSLKAPWFTLSVAAHLLLLGQMATLILPSPKRQPAALVPVQVLPSQTPRQATPTPEKIVLQQETRKPPPSQSDDLVELQKFRAGWSERADRLEQRLLEFASAATANEKTIEWQHQQMEAAQQEAKQLVGKLEEKTAQEQQLAARLAEEQTRRAQLEAELTEQRERREAELRMAQEAYHKLIADLQTEIARKDVAIHEFRDQLSITIVDKVLFPSGQEALTSEGKQILEKVGQVLARRTEQQIQIEGHTDNQDIGPELKKRFASNWELSTARATEVVRYLLAHTPLSSERLLAVGRADTMPVAENTTEAGRQQNRRIEIILLPPDKLKQTAQDSQRPPE